nr:hypothetical transcript [Hymenolepis microstoma]
MLERTTLSSLNEAFSCSLRQARRCGRATCRVENKCDLLVWAICIAICNKLPNPSEIIACPLLEQSGRRDVRQIAWGTGALVSAETNVLLSAAI